MSRTDFETTILSGSQFTPRYLPYILLVGVLWRYGKYLTYTTTASFRVGGNRAEPRGRPPLRPQQELNSQRTHWYEASGSLNRAGQHENHTGHLVLLWEETAYCEYLFRITYNYTSMTNLINYLYVCPWSERNVHYEIFSISNPCKTGLQPREGVTWTT